MRSRAPSMNSSCWRKTMSWWSVKQMSVWEWFARYSVSIGIGSPLRGRDVERGDVPAAQVGDVERLAAEGEVGRVTERVRGRVMDEHADRAVGLDPQDLARLVAAHV